MLDPRSTKTEFWPGILILLEDLMCTDSDDSSSVCACPCAGSQTPVRSDPSCRWEVDPLRCWSNYSSGDMLDQLFTHSFHCAVVSCCVAAAAAIINTSSCTSTKEPSELGGVAPGRNRGLLTLLPREWLRRGLTSLGFVAPKCLKQAPGPRQLGAFV